MIRSFLRRNQLFLINVSAASTFLAATDLLVQVFYEKKENLDRKRLSGAFVTGGAMGIEGHIWYSFLDRVIANPTWQNVFRKVVLDQTIAAPFYTLTYIVGTSTLEGRTSSAEIISDIQQNFIPLYLVDCLLYIPVQLVNFKYVPSVYRVPFLSVIAFIFDIFISAYKHQHEGIHVHNDDK